MGKDSDKRTGAFDEIKGFANSVQKSAGPAKPKGLSPVEQKMYNDFIFPFKLESFAKNNTPSLKDQSTMIFLYTVGQLGGKYDNNLLLAAKRAVSPGGKATARNNTNKKSFKIGKLAHDVLMPVRLAQLPVRLAKAAVYIPEMLADAGINAAKEWASGKSSVLHRPSVAEIEKPNTRIPGKAPAEPDKNASSNKDWGKAARTALVALPVVLVAVSVKLPCMAVRQILAGTEVGLKVAEKIIENPKTILLETAKVTAFTVARVTEAAVAPFAAVAYGGALLTDTVLKKYDAEKAAKQSKQSEGAPNPEVAQKAKQHNNAEATKKFIKEKFENFRDAEGKLHDGITKVEKAEIIKSVSSDAMIGIRNLLNKHGASSAVEERGNKPSSTPPISEAIGSSQSRKSSSPSR